MADLGEGAIRVFAGKLFVEELELGDGTRGFFWIEPCGSKHLFVPVQGGDGWGGGKGPQKVTIGAQFPEYGQVLFLMDSCIPNQSIEGHEGIVFGIGWEVDSPQTDDIGGDSSRSGQHHLLVDSTDTEKADKDFFLGLVKILYHPSHGFSLEPCPLFPVLKNNSPRHSRIWLW